MKHTFKTFANNKRQYPKYNNLCVKHKVKELYVFESVLTDRFSNESDIDFVVSFDNEIDDHFINFFDSLENLFNRSVNLVKEENIKNPYFKESVDSGVNIQKYNPHSYGG